MLTTGALIYGDAEHFLQHREDDPAALQLGGSDPEALGRCALLVEQAGYQEVNLNVGCPSDRVKQGGIGACLMAEPKLVADCVSAMKASTRIPVTVKTRIGIDDHDSYEFFHNFVSTVHAAGCDVFIIHARKAILEGLSPKENREIPPLMYDRVFQLKQDMPQLTIVINGGLVADDANNMLQQLDGVMYGREAYHNPWSLAQLEHAIFRTPLPLRTEVVDAYVSYMAEEMEKGAQIKHMAKHLLGLFQGLPGARRFRRHLSENLYQTDAGLNLISEAVAFVSLPERDAA